MAEIACATESPVSPNLARLFESRMDGQGAMEETSAEREMRGQLLGTSCIGEGDAEEESARAPTAAPR